jgi:hypothetical protein
MRVNGVDTLMLQVMTLILLLLAVHVRLPKLL